MRPRKRKLGERVWFRVQPWVVCCGLLIWSIPPPPRNADRRDRASETRGLEAASVRGKPEPAAGGWGGVGLSAGGGGTYCGAGRSCVLPAALEIAER